MNDFNLTLATSYKQSEEHLQAIIYALRGALGFMRRSGPDWNHTLFQLVQLIFLLIVPGRNGISTEDSGVSIFPTDRQILDFYHGLLDQLLIHSKKTFGLDTAYTKAVVTWHTDVMSSADKPLPGEKGFNKRFNKAQSKILSWAGVDVSRGIVLTK
jgi:hypothetical protein